MAAARRAPGGADNQAGLPRAQGATGIRSAARPQTTRLTFEDVQRAQRVVGATVAAPSAVLPTRRSLHHFYRRDHPAILVRRNAPGTAVLPLVDDRDNFTAQLPAGSIMAKQARLQMIQGVINRLASNSSAFKGWMVTIASALLGVAINNKTEYLGWLAVYSVCVLAVLDAYYLALEQAYRRLYDAATNADENEWSLNAGRINVLDVLRSLLSPSVWVFYGSAVVAAIVVATNV